MVIGRQKVCVLAVCTGIVERINLDKEMTRGFNTSSVQLTSHCMAP